MSGIFRLARSWLLRLVFRIHRSPRLAGGSRRILQFVLSRMSFAMPVHRLCETGTLLAFHHPQPAYPVHILLVPKRAISGLMALDPATDFSFLADLITTVQSLVTELKLDQAGYRLIANGGAYQDFPYLHFHLISEKKRLVE